MAASAPPLRTIASRRDAARVFAAQPSPRIITAALGALVAVRARGRRPGVPDLAAVAVVAASQGVHEWVIHRFVLHARPRTVRGTIIDPGVGHRGHHDDPDVIGDALLKPADAVLFLGLLGGYVALGTRPLRRHLGSAGTISAVGAAWAALLAYEWTHFRDHTSVELRSARARRLRAHHRRHHHVDDSRWLGITSTSGDRIFRTGTPVRTT